MMFSRILVVEDSELLHQMYEMTLTRYRQEGTKILHARNGLEALKALEENPDIGLVLLDMNMPVMDGLEFLRIKGNHAKYYGAKVIIVTIKGEEEDVQRGIAAGASGYVTKPIHPAELHAAIMRLLP
jgi:two-component system, chemotaxis family, chemotaxis protein CheY